MTNRQPKIEDGWVLYNFGDAETLRVVMFNDVKRVSALTGRSRDEAPTICEYRKYGRFKISSVCRVFEHPTSWFFVMEIMGLRPSKGTERARSTATYLDCKLAVDRVRREEGLPTGVAPSLHRYRVRAKALGLPSERVISRWGDPQGTSWKRAVRRMGLIPYCEWEAS